MSTSRRRFLTQSSAVAASTLLANRAHAMIAPTSWRTRESPGIPNGAGQLVDPSTLQSLAARAIEAAKAAGATYADVRLTRSITQGFDDTLTNTAQSGRDVEELAVGIRCLAGGTWGFASSGYWTLDEMQTLAQLAVSMAKASAVGRVRPVELGKVPIVTGHWSTPMEIDPFTVPMEEKSDYIKALGNRCETYRSGSLFFSGRGKLRNGSFISTYRQERAVMTSEGSFVTQAITYVDPAFEIMIDDRVALQFKHCYPGGRGWEFVRDAKLVDQIPALFDEAEEIMRTPTKPVDIGRYDVVCDRATMASLVSRTIGAATELDRAIGHEANATGTSYLGPDPLALLGTLRVAAPIVTITADRSMPGGTGTVQWDDEGITPSTATLVKEGMLNDYQTTREQAAWLSSYYEKNGMPAQSHGYAGADSALDITVQQRPNLTLAPAAGSATFASLVAGIGTGLALQEGSVTDIDFQAKTGILRGRFQEIRNGKLGAIIGNAAAQFSSPELWKNIIALGGADSSDVWDFFSQKGEPRQTSRHTVRAVPATIKNMTIVDPYRRS